MSSGSLNHQDLYRLPWSLPDNGISWLEPTSVCNLACDGCYRQQEQGAHKSMAELMAELDLFQRLRRSDCMSVAGGDPLVYPQIVELVAEIRRRGYKPILNTNGKALSMELLRELKRAGVFGFTFHVDSRQGRGGIWKDKDELQLNELRLSYAQMLAEVGGISCSFNSTVYADNIQHVPGMIDWAQQHIDIVHTMVFICFRHVIPDMPFDWYAGGKKIDWDSLWYHSDEHREIEIKSTDVLQKIRESAPDFQPAAYLNGTDQADSFKWLYTARIGDRDSIYGYLGPRTVELVSSLYHLVRGRYMSYIAPAAARMGKPAMLLWPLDPEVRHAAVRYLRGLVRSPRRLLRPAHIQTIMFIQPIDFLPDGGLNMCDGCPDITPYQGKLVWSCRLEEPKKLGTFLRAVPRER